MEAFERLETELGISLPKTSETYPILISWLFPSGVLHAKAWNSQQDARDGILSRSLSSPELIDDTLESEESKIHGNFGLSSCPGKKVRLKGDAIHRKRMARCILIIVGMVNRDLQMDFERIKSQGVSIVICCLDDHELSFLGCPWDDYVRVASLMEMDVIRIPMLNGSCPQTIEELDPILHNVNMQLDAGKNILCHCRGGVGRAGLIACCFLLYKGYCTDPEDAIRFLRVRRSPRAIETRKQEDFIRRYAISQKRRI